MKRKIIISNKEFTMPKMSIDTYTEYLDIAEQIDTHPRYTKQDIEPLTSRKVSRHGMSCKSASRHTVVSASFAH